MAGNYFANLPAYRNSGELDFNPLNQAVQNFGETTRANAMAEYQAGRNKVADGRAAAGESRAQYAFDQKKGEEALNQLAGIYQAIETAPEAERGAMIQRAMPMYDRLRKNIPDFDADFAQIGADPNDFMSVGKLISGRVAGYQAPKDPLDVQYKQAQINKINREASESGSASFGKTGSVFQDKDGRFYTAQFAADGTRRITPLDVGMTPARGTSVVGDEVINDATGQTVRNVGGAIAGGERAKGEGKAQAELTSSLPKLEFGFQAFANKSDRLVDVLDRAIARVGTNTTGYGAVLQNLPATEARALARDLDTVRANIGFEELQAMRDASPTGGALGQVSEMENRLLQSVRGAMDQYDKGENLAANLKIIRDSVTQLKALKTEQLASDRARAGGTAAAQPANAPANGGWSIQRVD